MPLKIVKSSEPITIDRINLCIYGPPGLGKTTLAFTADEPILFDFDKGAYRAKNRKDIVPVVSWNEVAELTAEDLAEYKTVVIDTAGRALDRLSEDIIAANPKAGRAGALTLQGFGTLKVRFAGFLRMLNSFGKDVVLIAHMDEQRSGDDVIERLDVQGGSKGEIYKSVDAMGRIFVRNKERVIDFSPRENAFGKNPAGLEILPIPHPDKNPLFLAEVISLIKTKLNELSEEQRQAQQQIQEWSDAITAFTSEAEFNKNLADVKKAPKAAQLIFAEKAKALGFVFDKAKNAYSVAQHA
jgi:hypothetical protein